MNDFLLFLLSVFNHTANHKLVLWNPVHLFFILNSLTQGASLQLRTCCRQLKEIVKRFSESYHDGNKLNCSRRQPLLRGVFKKIKKLMDFSPLGDSDQNFSKYFHLYKRKKYFSLRMVLLIARPCLLSGRGN